MSGKPKDQTADATKTTAEDNPFKFESPISKRIRRDANPE
jgi:hypothetical protein